MVITVVALLVIAVVGVVNRDIEVISAIGDIVFLWILIGFGYAITLG